MTTPVISPELRAFLSCLYFEAIFFEPFSDSKSSVFKLESIALRGSSNSNIKSKEIYPLILEIMEKHPEYIDNRILLNGSLVRINGRPCDYCNYYNIREKMCEYLKKITPKVSSTVRLPEGGALKQGVLDWNQFVVNADTFPAQTLSIKVNTENQHLLLLMLNQLNEPVASLLD